MGAKVQKDREAMKPEKYRTWSQMPGPGSSPLPAPTDRGTNRPWHRSAPGPTLQMYNGFFIIYLLIKRNYSW